MEPSIVREGTREEIGIRLPDFAHPMWCGIIEENGDIVGHILCSNIFGKAWLHDLRHWGSDKTAVKRLTALWKERLPLLGIRDVRGEYRDKRQMEIALLDGWLLESTVLRREI